MNKSHTLPSSLADLKAVLQEAGFTVFEQKETDQLYLLFSVETAQLPLFIKFNDETELLQLLFFMPLQLNPSSLNDALRLLHHLNKEVDLPGFCFDETNQLFFYRLVFPHIPSRFAPHSFLNMIQACQAASQSVLPIIAAVAAGAVSFEEFIQQNQPGKAAKKSKA